jgi:hypothetical protein
MEKNKEIIANISNIIFDNKEKLSNKDFLDLNNQLKELFNNLNDNDNDNPNDALINAEPRIAFSYEWWDWYKEVKFNVGCHCLLMNSKTKKLYKGTLMEIFPNERKAKFALFHDWQTGEQKNIQVIINYNNKKSLYRFSDHI